MPFAKEPFDTKLFVILMMKKLWLILGAMIIGVVLIGGGYYLKKVVFGEPTEYEITSTYYVEYNSYDTVTGELRNYTNPTTWGTWVVSDYFVGKAWDYAIEAGLEPDKFAVKKEDLKQFFTADLPSDLRIPTSTVTTPYEELTILLNEALQKVYVDFGTEQTEMDSIRVTNTTPVVIADKDIRIFNACTLGAVMGMFTAVFLVAIMIIWDDSIILPDSFSYRYGIPMAGYAGRQFEVLSKESLTNLQYLFADKESKRILTIGNKENAKAVAEKLVQTGFSENLYADALDTAAYEKLRSANGILLLVEAGARNSREIEHLLHELELQDCLVTGAFLYQADELVIRLVQGKRN